MSPIFLLNSLLTIQMSICSYQYFFLFPLLTLFHSTKVKFEEEEIKDYIECNFIFSYSIFDSTAITLNLLTKFFLVYNK